MVYKPAIKNNFAFTLVELLIAVSVMLILTAVTVMLLNPTKLRSDANETKALSELGTVTNAMEFYYSDKKSYPLILGELSTDSYINDGGLLTDDAGASYCYLRVLSGVSPNQKVSSYKICTKSTKVSAPAVNTLTGYNGDECSYAATTQQVQCLQSPF